MSGPKSSRYTLTPEQRKALMITLQKNIIQQERVKLSALLAQIENEANNIQHYGNDHVKEKPLDTSLLIRQYSPLLSERLLDDLESLNAQSNALRSARQTVTRAQTAMKKTAEGAKISWKKQMTRDLSKGFGSTLDSALDAKKDAKQQVHQKRIALLQEMIEAAVRNETAAQAKKLLIQYQQADTDAFRDTLFTTSIHPLFRQYQTELDQYSQEEAEYQERLLRYNDLCEELSVPQEPQPWSPGAMENLRALIEEMEQRILQREEEAYICRALDEVMQEMGYPLLGTRDVTKRSGKRFRHALYTFEDGTAIDVTYSDDGQIAMELGGLDDQDRIPDEQETIYLCDAMEGFCTSFGQIEERLRQRGIILKERIHMLPPTEENAQIINTEDYHLSASPSMLDVKHHTSGSSGKKQKYKDGE